KPLHQFKIDNIKISSGIDWLEIKLNPTDESFPIEKILSAYRKKELFVELGDGSVGVLPQEWLKKYIHVLEVGDPHKNSLRYTQSNGLFAAASFRDETNVEIDKALREKFDFLLKLSPKKQSAKVSKKFHGKLRPYQQQGLA